MILCRANNPRGVNDRPFSKLRVRLQGEKYYLIVGLLLVLSLCVVRTECQGQDSLAIKHKRQTYLWVGQSVTYTTSMIGLYSLWYASYPQSSFHFFDDSKEWLQMDKSGHFFASYQIGRLMHKAYTYCGVSENLSLWLGGSMGLLFLSTVEVFDGFSKEWGFSVSDMAANILGAGAFIGQEMLWSEQRILFKYAYIANDLHPLRANLLGKSLAERVIKDYNGIKIWASITPADFLPREHWMPKWLSVAFGYGATGMLGGFVNPPTEGTREIQRMRQYFLSLDINVKALPIQQKWIKHVLSVFDVIKIPFPTIEYNSNGQFVFHPIYF